MIDTFIVLLSFIVGAFVGNWLQRKGILLSPPETKIRIGHDKAIFIDPVSPEEKLKKAETIEELLK